MNWHGPLCAVIAWLCLSKLRSGRGGIAFFGSYVFHGFLTYSIARWLSGFRWSAANWQAGRIFLSLIATVFCSFYMLSFAFAVSIGTLALIGSCIYSVRVLVSLVPFAHLPRPLRRLITALGIVPFLASA